VVSSNELRRSSSPGTDVTFEFSEQHLKDELARNQEPVEWLYRTLEAYFFAGYPRPPDNDSPPAEQHIPLTQLVDITERWIIAHEYGHGFAARMEFTARANERDDVNQESAEEFFADDDATILAVMSAARLDAVGPAVSLAGPAFALACLEVVRRGLSVVCCGKVLPSSGDSVHPPNKMRIMNVLSAYDFYFEEGLQNEPNKIDLTWVLRPPGWKPEGSEAKKKLHDTIYLWSNMLFMIWDQVSPRLQEDFQKKRRVHSIWDASRPVA